MRIIINMIAGALPALLWAPGLRAQEAESEVAWNVHGQATVVGQGYPGFRSPYQGAQSLSGASQFKDTVSATVFIGLRPWRGGELYFNPELMQGFGLNDTHGVAGFPNGEAQKSNFPLPKLNAARMYFSQTIGLGGEREPVEDRANQLGGDRSVSRLTVTAGKFAVTDFFLVNSISGEPRTAFLNWNVYGTGAYDWTMDLLSWTWGALFELNQPRWALRAGYFLLPAVANTDRFDLRGPAVGQWLAELEHRHSLFDRPGKVQLFGWLAHGNIGSYPAALARSPAAPDVAQTRGRDRFNEGLVLSFEQAVSDALGLFARASWSPEEGESMGWTDCGQAFTAGGVLKGASWHRPEDALGVAGLIEGLSPVARRYFAAGGMGTIIGDGALHYRPEMVLEAYYAYRPLRWATATLDAQVIDNPGYNADRGPVTVFSLRLHADF
jgi:high affinity Mn2+ porin